MTDLISPMDVAYGAAGDGVTDDTDAVNAMFADMRDSLEAFDPVSRYLVGVDGRGKWFRCEGYVDATLLNGRGLGIRNLQIISAAEDKIGIDFTGSSLLNMDEMIVCGDPDSPPDVGAFFGRADQYTAPAPHPMSAFHTIRLLDVSGKYKKCAVGVLGSEVLDFWALRAANTYHTSTSAATIVAGHSDVFTNFCGMPFSQALQDQGNNQVIGDGSMSMGNCTIGMHNAQKGPAYSYDISLITKAATAYVTIDAADLADAIANYGFGTGAKVFFEAVIGSDSTWANGVWGRVATVGSHIDLVQGTFDTDLDTSGITGTFTSGKLMNDSGPAVVIGQVSSFHQLNGYILAHSTEKYLIDPRSATERDWSIKLRGRHEMQGRNLVRILGGSSTVFVRQLEIDDDNSNSYAAVIRGDGCSGSGKIRLENPQVYLGHKGSAASVGMFENPGVFEVRGGRLQAINKEMVQYGVISDIHADWMVSDAVPSIIHAGQRRFLKTPMLGAGATVASASGTYLTAPLLTLGLNVVTGADGSKAVRLPNPAATWTTGLAPPPTGGDIVMVVNNSASVLKLYATGDAYINGAQHTAMNVAANSSVLCWAYDGANWWTVPHVPS